MKNLSKDILMGVLFITGISSFISGLFIFSSLLFATASMFSNLNSATKANS